MEERDPFVSAEMITAAEDLLVAIALEQTIQPVVEQYEEEILQRLQLRTAERYKAFGIDHVVLKRNELFLLSEKDIEQFIAESRKAREAAKLPVEYPENCPLAVATHVRSEAETTLLAMVAKHPLLSGLADTSSLSLGDRAKAVSLTLDYMSRFIRSPEEILGRVMRDAVVRHMDLESGGESA